MRFLEHACHAELHRQTARAANAGGGRLGGRKRENANTLAISIIPRGTPKSGHVQRTSSCLLWANSGHPLNYSITSSERAFNAGGIDSPSAFAIVRFIREITRQQRKLPLRESNNPITADCRLTAATRQYDLFEQFARKVVSIKSYDLF